MSFYLYIYIYIYIIYIKNIDNPRIFRTLIYVKLEIYLELSERFKMECLPKIVKSCIFPKRFILDV